MSQSRTLLRTVTLGLYRQLLFQAKHLFDENARQFAANRIRFRFRDNINELGASRIHQLLKEGRHQLRFLKKVNLGDLMAVEKVLQLTYGRTGKRKHELLAPYYKEVAEPKDPLITNVPRSASPSIPPPIQALMNRDPNVKHKFEMANPPVYKPLSKRREVNAMWRHYAEQRKALRAPLSKPEVEELQVLANGVKFKTPDADIRRKLQEEYEFARSSTAKFQGRPTGLSPRFLRRRYKNLLEGYIPTISEENGRWKVDCVTGTTRKYPALDPKHMAGITFSDGTKANAVESKGETIKSSE